MEPTRADLDQTLTITTTNGACGAYFVQTITKAATLLKTSEYRIFSEAYLNWYGDRADTADLDDIFSRFMMFGEIPPWADNYAQALINDTLSNRQVNLSSYCVLNMNPRVGSRKKRTSFTIVQ